MRLARTTLALAALSWSTIGSATVNPPPKWQSVEREVRAIVGNLKSRWQVLAIPEFPDDDTIAANPKGEDESEPSVEFGRRLVTARLTPLTPTQRSIYLRWMVGHELWHRHQFQLAGERLDEAVSNPQRECEADVMGSWFAAEDILGAMSTKMKINGQMEARDALVELRDAIDPKLPPNARAEDYPDLEQRRQAIRLGVSRTLIDRLLQPARASEPGAAEALEGLRKGAMVDTEPVDAWLRKVCSRVVHSGFTADKFHFGKPHIVWNKSNDNPVVDFSIVVENRSDHPAHLFLRVLTSLASRADRDNTLLWSPIDGKDFELDLAPSEPIVLEDTLRWNDPELRVPFDKYADFMPIIVLPGIRDQDPGVLFDAVPNWAKMNMTNLSKTQSELAEFLVHAVSAAPSAFETLPWPCNFRHSAERCEITGAPERFTGARFRKKTSGGPNLFLDIYNGKDANEAARQFRLVAEDLRAIVPDAEFLESTDEGAKAASGGVSLSVRGVERLRIELDQFRFGTGKDSRYDVTLSIFPEH